MNLGIIARSDNTGLGYQTKSYYDHLSPAKTLVVDISSINGNEQHPEWYPDGVFTRGFPLTKDLSKFLDGLDVVLTAESPYNYELYSLARQKGVKTAVAYNYEFFDWFKYPEYPLPDLLIAPSMWNYGVIDEFAQAKGIKHIYLHHPVDRQQFPFSPRTTSKPIHIAGKPAAHDRNGTWDFLQAFPDGTVITQSLELAQHIRMRYRHSKVYTGIGNPADMYKLGDILILPRRYGGNCLPLNEALSCGMPVIMPDISPNNHLLPSEWLVQASVKEYFEPRTKIEVHAINVGALQEKMEWFRHTDMLEQSIKANVIADSISWDTLKPKYLEALEGLCES